jgi:hypothetical protein
VLSRTALAGILLLAVSTIGGCVTVTTRTTGAATLADLGAEDQYRQVYAQQMGNVHVGLALFAPNGSNPGVCNVGGTKLGCYDADTALIRDFEAMRTALEATTVPPRFVDADTLLRAAIDKDIQGLQLRNQAIATNDDALWKQHGPVLAEAQTAFQAAYRAFPEDNRPLPAP